jgi:hypothetical protein
MSDADAADEWEVVVPEDDAELVAELRRHGVQPGQRLHVRPLRSGDYVRGGTVVTGAFEPSQGEADEARAASVLEPEYVGGFDSGQPDLAERSEEILRARFPDR